jgi:hypothetical protein
MLGRREFDANAFGVIRELQRKFGTVAIPDRTVCQACRNKKQAQEMARIATTGAVTNVQDCICLACAKENLKEFSRIARIICAGCREVVAMVEPFKEPNGFIWRPGAYYHAAECPVCTKRFSLTKSYIAEQIWFYKKYGIPYE